MPQIPIDAELEGGIAQGLRPSETGIQAATQAGYHAQREFGVLGKAASDVSDVIENHETLKSNIAASDQTTAIQNKARAGWRDALAHDPNADPEAWLRDNVQPDIDKLADLAHTPASRAHIAQLQHELLGSLNGEFHADRNKADTDSAEASATDVYTQAGKDARDDPANITSILNLAKTKSAGILAAGGVPAALQASHNAQQAQRVGDQALDGIAGRAEAGQMNGAQIDATLAALRNPDNAIRKAASEGGYGAAIERLEKAKATLGNIDAAVQDVQRPLLLDALRQGDPNAYGTLTAMSQNPKGDSPKERAVYTAEVLRDRDEAQNFYEGSKTIQNMSQDQARTLTEAMPLESARTGLQKGIVEAYKDRETGLDHDAVGWVATHNRTAGSAYAAWQQNQTPENWQRLSLVQTAIQKQLRPGEPVHLLTPEITDEAQGIIRGITTTPEGAAGASPKLFAMSQKYGADWGPLAHDLKAKGVLSDEQYVAARLYSNPQAQGTAEAVLTASAMKPADRFNLHGIPEAKARKAAIGALTHFEATLANANDRQDVVSGFTDALTHLLQTQAVDSSNLDAQATQAAQKLILNEFQTAGATHTIRVPATLDADAVTSGSEQALADIAKRDIVIPPSAGALNPANQKTNYLRTIQLGARWYTNEDGSGIKLYDQDMHTVMEKKGGKTVPVSLTWGELTRTAKSVTQNAGQENIATYQQYGR